MVGYFCCVPNCKRTTKDSVVHRFPKETALWKQWLELIQRPDLTAELLKNYRVCDVHFGPESRIPTNYHSRSGLMYGALPSLHLPINVEIEAEFLEPVAGPSGISRSVSKSPEPADRSTGKRKKLTTPIKRRKRRLLQAANVTRSGQLTPRAKSLYELSKKMRKTVARLQQQNVSTKMRLKEALHSSETGEVYAEKVNRTTMRFLMSQIASQQKQPRGRRYTTEDKIFALSILKNSPKSYKLLRRIFALPSRKTLIDLLRRIPQGCGVNEAILASLKKNLSTKEDTYKFCTIMFDEMSLSPGLSYNVSTDTIEGFQNCGETVTNEFADHAMVFMARGIHDKWKQPLAYYYTKNGMNNTDIVRNLTSIIRAVRDAGLKVVATVSDQYTTNVAAVKAMKAKTTEWCIRNGVSDNFFGYAIDGEEVVHLYDGPHLLKGLRNNMLQSDVEFSSGGEKQTAKWSHLEELFEIDQQPDDFKLCARLTEQHIVPDKIKKMKVKFAAQVFSQRVSSIMRFLANKAMISPEAVGTANYLLLVDKLFDSINGSTAEASNGKMLRCGIMSKSQHLAFWEDALKTLQTVRYVRNGRETVPPSVSNFSLTIRGIRHIWLNLAQHPEWRFLLPRNLNQDPLENFFGSIRSQAGRNVNPTCSSFTASYRTLVINNFTSAHSPGSNCEEDEHEGALDKLQDFLEMDDLGVAVLPDEAMASEEIDGEEQFQCTGQTTILATELHDYLAGYVARRLLRTISCQNCRNKLIEGSRRSDSLVAARAYNPKALINAHPYFRKTFTKSCEVLHFFLPKICHENNLMERLKRKLDKYVLNPLEWDCEEHNLKQTYTNIFVKFYVLAWVNNVNKILKGLDSRNLNDPIKLKAHAKYAQCRKRQIAVSKLKKLV